MLEIKESKLTRIDTQKIISIKKQWKKECAKLDQDIQNLLVSKLDYFEKIAREDPPDERYGVYCLELGRDYPALMHINHARLPKTTGTTLRVLWGVLSPRFEISETSDYESELTHIMPRIFLGIYGLAKNIYKTNHVKILISSSFDKEIFNSLAIILEQSDLIHSVSVKGAWLHFSL